VTFALLTALALLAAFGLYFGVMSARAAPSAREHLDAGLTLPTWVMVFAGAGVSLATIGLYDQLRLLATYGLQANQIAIGLIVAALFAALFQKRVWVASRLTGLSTIGNLLGAYFGSITIRLYLLFVLFLFSIPVAAYCLAEIGRLLEAGTGGAVPASYAIWGTAIYLFIAGALGGWRGTLYWVAMLSLVCFVFIVFSGGFIVAGFDTAAFATRGIVTAQGILADRIPGVIQFSAGIGREAAIGGPFTAIAGFSFAIGMIGISLSPAFSFLGITTSSKKGFALSQVWMIAGVSAGLLALIGPVIAAEIAALGNGGQVEGLVSKFAALNQLSAAALLIMLVASLQIAIAFFANSGASIVTLELVNRYILPEITETGQRLAARIALAGIYLCAAAVSNFTPLSAAVFGALALSLSVQLLPAYLGLCWVSWISRSGVIAGLIIGTLLVVFTEPFGLILFDRFFVEIPWGRWPLTIHSAAWGLAFNFLAVLLVSLFSRGGEERLHRERLHDAYGSSDPRAVRGAAITARWSLILIWSFLALGPGAILGNTFFSDPIFTEGSISPGLPSLLIWQILFWIIGVVLVWWLAYQGRLSVIASTPKRIVDLAPPGNLLFDPTTPPWISRLLGRVVNR
jgi:SSS family solute:Na+ symporter